MKKMIVKGMMAVGVLLSLGLHSIKVEAKMADGFCGVKDTYLEAGDSFSTINGISYYENGQKKNFSVYLYKTKTGYKKVSSTHYINTKVSGKYQLRFESANGKYKAWKKVIIKDTKKPYLSGVSDISINYGSKFSTTKNVKGFDLADGKRGYSVYYNEKKVSKKNYISTKKVGYHKLRYEISDKAGNKNTYYRNIYVKPKTVKTAKKSTVKVKNSGRVHTIYPKLNSENGFWYNSYYYCTKFYVHSLNGESLNRFNKGDIVKFYVEGKWYTYIIYDKFICYGDKSQYRGVPSGKNWYAPTRGRSMEDTIANAPVALQTCNDNGYSTLKYVLMKPYGNSKTWRPR
ncbi:hypothetical protein K5E_11370 [Enterococcus thailandicus]|uniref:hypothetical protein n=1 Tax=Enterococcus thailandicus TaxID=417368 RepID=UPI00244D939E|nr:hypothetical protein [Enterococcus thailandicus]GMC02565.1 hypothetical protein K4E_00750 [Enterococcus thailandicus]GMC08998.1 hypothetical protein K5E_11370 [Enterococcus thailandicus]